MSSEQQEESPEEFFDRDPSEQAWWKEGKQDFPYREEMPDSVEYDENPRPIPEEEYLENSDLEEVRGMFEETGTEVDEFIDELYESDVHPVHKWQIKQVVQDPAQYATEADFDGAPRPPQDSPKTMGDLDHGSSYGANQRSMERGTGEKTKIADGGYKGIPTGGMPSQFEEDTEEEKTSMADFPM